MKGATWQNGHSPVGCVLSYVIIDPFMLFVTPVLIPMMDTTSNRQVPFRTWISLGFWDSSSQRLSYAFTIPISPFPRVPTDNGNSPDLKHFHDDTEF